MATRVVDGIEQERPLTRLLGIDLPWQCLICNDNANSKKLIERIEQAGIDLELFRHDEADDDALPILKIGDKEMGPGDPGVDSWLDFLAYEASKKVVAEVNS